MPIFLSTSPSSSEDGGSRVLQNLGIVPNAAQYHNLEDLNLKISSAAKLSTACHCKLVDVSIVSWSL
jgi:hypothetical protein